MTDQLLTITEAAKYLKVNPMTIRRWAKNGRLGFIRVGVVPGKIGNYRFRPEDIEEFFKGYTDWHLKSKYS